MRKVFGILMLLLILSGCSYGTERAEPVIPSTNFEETHQAAKENVVSTEEEHSEPTLFQEEPIVPIAEYAVSEEDGTDSSETSYQQDSTTEQSELMNQTESEITVPTHEEDPMPEPDSSFSQEEEPPAEEESEEEALEPTSSTEISEPEQEPEPSQPEPVTETTTEEPEPEYEPDADFEIGYWISYAKSLAESKGLKLDASATDCWDNPITANADCIYLERDINSRLSRYANDEEITDVWIWYEELGNQQYLIYIGYA